MSNIYKTSRVPISIDHWSEHQDKLYRKCPLAWYRKSVLKLRAKVEKPIYFTRGQAYHTAFEEFYSLPPEDRELEFLIANFSASVLEDIPEEIDAQPEIDTGTRVLNKYWEKYGKDPQIPQAETEVEGQVEIPNTSWVFFNYRLDLLIRSDPFYFVLDFKTGERVSPEDHISADLQMPRYIWALQESGVPLRTGVLQFLKLLRNKSAVELTRRVIMPSSREISWAVHDLAMLINDIRRPDKLIYHNWTTQCNWCDYYNLCLTAKMGGDPQGIEEEQFYHDGTNLS